MLMTYQILIKILQIGAMGETFIIDQEHGYASNPTITYKQGMVSKSGLDEKNPNYDKEHNFDDDIENLFEQLEFMPLIYQYESTQKTQYWLSEIKQIVKTYFDITMNHENIEIMLHIKHICNSIHEIGQDKELGSFYTCLTNIYEKAMAIISLCIDRYDPVDNVSSEIIRERLITSLFGIVNSLE